MADSMADYQALGAVSAGVIDKMVNECAKAAWFDSFLNPDRPHETSKAMDRGTVAHQILLEGSESGICVIDFANHPNKKGDGFATDFKNTSARAERDAAYATGLTPMVKEDMVEVRAMTGVAHEFIDSLKDNEPDVWRMFQQDGGASEATITWQDGNTLCKMRPDRINAEKTIILNYKTTQGTVEPERWARTQLLDYYLGGAFYCRGARATFGTDPEHLYLVQQVSAPYLCSLVGLDPHFLDLGARKVTIGLAMWEDCIKRGRWPGYPARVVWPEVPTFEEIRWQEKEAMIPLLGSQG